jgi:lipoate-protein ligase A
MAADEVLLESAADGVATLRFYGWSPATLSLGYFQSAEVRMREPSLAALPFVRRASGGAALVHHFEVTYALALPAGPPWQQGGPWPRRMHTIIAVALREEGVEVQSHSGGQGPPFTGVLCFQHHTAGDLLIGQHKVVGSAQRRQRGALLQHGSILLAASPHTPLLPGIRQLTGRSLTVEQTCVTVRHAFEQETGWAVVSGDWTSTERRRLAELVVEKYGRESWNCKR